MSLRGAQGSLRRGFARMVKPLKSGLTSSRSREEELRDEREFERLFLLFEAFLHTDRSRPASPSSSPSPAADVDLPLPLRQFVGGRSDSDDHHANGDGDDEMKSKRRRRLSFGRERRKSVSKKKSEDDKKNEDDGHGSQAPKAVAIAAELGEDGDDNNNNKQKKNEDGDETRQPAKGKNEDGGGGAEEEHEVRFVVGLLNGYLALKRLGAGDKDLTFSLAHNKKKEEERERRELEKLRGEVVLRMTSALADLGALPAAATDAGSAQLSASAAARPSGVARHQSTDYRIPASRSSPMMTKHNRTSWRGRLRSKEKEKKAAAAAVSVEEQQQAGGKDKKPQQPDSEERSGSTAQKSEENAKNESHDWRDRFLSPRSQHKRSQSLTFEPQGVKTMSIDVLVADDDDDSDDWHDSEPRIPLAELEERLCRMEELIERKFAKQHPAMEAQSAAELKKSKRRSLNQLLRRSTNKITGHKDRKDTIDKANKADDDDNDDDGEDNEGEATDLGDEGSGIYAIPASIYTKVTNRRRSVYHYNLDSIREMIHQHHQHQHHTTTKSDGDHDQPQPALPEENEARDGGKSEGKNEDGKGEGESDDVMQGTPVKIVFTAPSSPPVPTLNLNQDEGFLSPDAPKATPLPPPCHVSVSSTATSAFASSSPSTSTKTATSTTTESEAAAATTAARNWRRTVHDKRDKMLRMRVMDSKFAGQAKNVKRAFLWCEENVAPVTLVKVVKAQAFAKRFLARRLRKRLQIANELLVTEKHYVDILDLLVKVFLRPLREGDLLPPESILAIFGNTETLRDKHVLFHELLHKRVRDWMTFQQFGVGDIFYDHTDFLLGYTEYVNNFDKALAMLTRCTKSSPEFALFVRNCEARPECNLHDLPSLLITPVQRIPRYTLLLQDLQRHTPSGSRPGLLEMALKKVKDIANYINEQKRANENELKMAELDSRLVFDPKPKIGLCEVPARKFIKEGKVLIQLGRKHFKECHVFLFTDLLLITKNEDLDDNDEEAAKEKEAEPKRNDVADEHHPSGKLPRYLVKAAEPLNENPIEISPLPPFFLDKATRFPLRLYFSSQRKEYRCVFASQNERDDWLQRIVSAHASARRRPYSILSVRRGFTATSAGAHQGQPPAL